MPREQRRLAAILAADVVGYSRLMGRDESGALARLREHRKQRFEPTLARHGGRLVKLTGDGALAEFPSAVDALGAAIEFQQSMAEANQGQTEDVAIVFRIGLHLGDLIVDGDDLYGDGVNVAARLEAEAPSGGIVISGDVHNAVTGRLKANFDDLGALSLKNIERPVQAFGVKWESADWQVTAPPVAAPPIDAVASPADVPLALPDKPSIAVLPFQNMSGDPEQEYFADGLTEDIITALSKHRWLDVIARNTTFAYKGRSPDIRKLAAELGADYAVEGSVRRAAQRIRVTAQLIDTGTGNHVWAERYDRNLADIFDVQDEITQTIVGRIEPEIGTAVRQKTERAPRRDLRAWDCYHLGVANFYKFTAEGNQEAQRLLQQSRELDPGFAEAHSWWAYATILGMVYWDTEPDPRLMDEALAAARRALSLDNQNALLHMLMGRVQLARREYRSAITECETAVRLNPTLALAYCGLGDSFAYEGRYDEAIAQFEKAVEMSPNHPQLWAFLGYGALSLLFSRQFEKALDWAERARDIPNCQYWATAHAAVALAHLDRREEARAMVERLLAEQPRFTRAFAEKRLFYIRRPEQLQLYLEGLGKAGVQAG